MSQTREDEIRVLFDPMNPGHFFACCALLELADRIWGRAMGWHEAGTFVVRPVADKPVEKPSLKDLLGVIAAAPLEQVDSDDDYASPIILGTPFNFRLDWWTDEQSGGKSLKVWAGSMRSIRIARAMQSVLREPEFQNETLLDHAMIVFDPLDRKKKVEPFYFDARRGSNALPLDIGFSPDSFQMTTAAYPAVEFLCLVGLQRVRPLTTGERRFFDYYTWAVPLESRLAPVAACGLLPRVGARGFRFENAFRTDQKKHKAYTPATPF